MKLAEFRPSAPLLPGRSPADCRCSVVIPACNEEEHLAACLDALRKQVDLRGRPLSSQCFEVLLLLNNCTDRSEGLARLWQTAHPQMRLEVVTRNFAPQEAHAGTARRLLMDTAWARLQGRRPSPAAILSTDADSTVAEDWIAQNLLALDRGADVVGGYIALPASELRKLPRQARHSYEQDRRYAELIARLEDLLDPQEGDRWPRHLDHFGSSLACTTEAYARAGGMPPVCPLEDEAFVDRVRRADLWLRHEPAVRVFTCARLEGRASVGFSGQLRAWTELPNEAAQQVLSAVFLEHRFRTLRKLRRVFTTGDAAAIQPLPARWGAALQRSVRECSVPEFLAALDCDALIRDTFAGAQEQAIADAIPELELRIAALQPKSRRAEMAASVLRAIAVSGA